MQDDPGNIYIGAVVEVGGENTEADVDSDPGQNTEAEAGENADTTEVSLETYIEELLRNSEEDSETGGSVYSNTISKPSPQMYGLNPKAFEPQLISIGPYYLRMNSLRPMVKHKLRIYLRLLRRLYGSADIHNNHIKTTVDNLVSRCKKCYLEAIDVNISDSEFSLMMALDGCFIIELFRYHQALETDQLTNIDDPVYGTRWILPVIRVDLIKLGNQLPFFVLQELYDVTHSTDQESPLAEVAASFFTPLLRANNGERINVQDHGHAHLLALFHSTFKPVTADETHVLIPDGPLPEQENIGSLGSASDLLYHQILIKKRNCNLLNIKSNKSGSILEIPSLLIDLHTGIVLLNLVAHEQSSRSISSYFMPYLVLLIGLVKSEKDVKILRSRDILKFETSISDKQVHLLLNSIAKGVTLTCDAGGSYLSTTISAVTTRKTAIRFRCKDIVVKIIHPNKDTLLKLFFFYLSLVQTYIAASPYSQNNR